ILAQRQQATLEKHVAAAEEELWALTPAPGRGKRQYRDTDTLQAAIAHVLARHEVSGLLAPRWERARRPGPATWAVGGVALIAQPARRARSAMPSLACSGTRRPLRPG